MPESLLTEIKRYIGFGPTDEAALHALLPVARPQFPEIAAAFYARALEHDGARAVLTGGEAQLHHLRCTLVEWLERTLAGPWDGDYFALRSRIGRAHVRIGLAQHYMFAGMNVLRAALNGAVDRGFGALEQRSVIRAAVARVLDMELAIMLDSYREDLLEQRARTERLSTFGQLVGSIAHELRNPLGVIESSAYVLRHIGEGDPATRAHLDRIHEQVALANGIVGSMLELIRERPLLRSEVALGPLIQAAAAAVPRPPQVKLSFEGLDGITVDGDPTQLRQAFRNLVENAVHAVAQQGEIRVRRVGGDGAASLLFEDSGPGVDPSILPRLFEPLATTKPLGTGLGLALVKQIVERHGGRIGYEPRDGGGARFVVQLPRQEPA